MRAPVFHSMLAAVLALLTGCSGGGGATSSSSASSLSSSSGSVSSSSGGGETSSTGGGSGSGSSGSSGSIDQAQLERYRGELPKAAWLLAPHPDPSSEGGGMPLVGAPAEYPESARPIVQGINGSIHGILDVLKTITDMPPTVYNSETLEFVWGPHNNDDSPLTDDKWLVYARDNEDEGDFRYTWAILRGVGNDTATFAPIIWGGANPDADDTNDDFGSGVILFDFEADYVFEEEHNPSHGALDRGRYVTVYSRGPDENDATKVNTFVVAAFRNFIPKDKPGAEPADLDYLYGHTQDGEHGFSFVDISLTGDVHQPPTPDGGTPSELQETLSLRLAFFNNGIGRGESRLTGGDVEAAGHSAGQGVECWGDNVERQYFELNIIDADSTSIQVQKEGEETDCHTVFQASLDELNIPSLADIPADMMTAIDVAATNGIPQD